MKQIVRVMILLVMSAMVGCWPACPYQQPQTAYPHYQIHVKLDPQSRHLQVNGSISLDAEWLHTPDFGFYLERNLMISALTINGKTIAYSDTTASASRLIPNARKIIFTTPAGGDTDQKVRIDFAYQGTLSELPEYYANTMSTNWTELGLYYPWFPFNMEQLGLFTYDLRVEAPSGYAVFGLGKVTHHKGFTAISSAQPTNDIVICLSQEVRVYACDIDDQSLKLYYHHWSDDLVDDLAMDISQIMHTYNAWFGSRNQGVSFIESLREKGGGYARRGGLVLAGITEERYRDDTEGYLRYFAHELAHLWWYQAPVNNWQDWLNESLAEYAAHLYIREAYGNEAFERRMQRKKERIANVPPIWGFDRENASMQQTQEVLYNKGPVLLYELEQKMGKREFLAFCQVLITHEVKDTETLLRLLEQEHGEIIALWFGEELQTR